MSQKITQNLKTLRKQIRKKGKPNQTIKLVAVTKTRSAEQVSLAIEAGVSSIGENKVQEAEAKFSHIEKIKSVEKRLIGQLQSNKIKKAIKLFDTIDSVDSTKLAKKISKASALIKKKQRVLIQVNTSDETTKGGFEKESIDEILLCFNLKNIKILQSLSDFHQHKVPLLLGPSRKSFIGTILNEINPKNRVWGTGAIVAYAIAQKISILRIHDTKEMNQIRIVLDKLRKAS